MTPGQILMTIQAVSNAVAEIFKWLQTDEGKEVVQQSLEDRKKWDEFWAQVADGIQKLFKGELFVGGGQ